MRAVVLWVGVALCAVASHVLVFGQIEQGASPLTNLISSDSLAGSAAANSALVGKWEQRSGSSSITYRDRATGSYAAPSGNINRYVFMPDGQYEYAELHQVSTYGCTTGYFGYEKGTYTDEGNRVTFVQRQHSLEFKSTCNPSLNSNKKLPLETATYLYQIDQGQHGQEFVISNGKSARWRFNHAQ